MPILKCLNQPNETLEEFYQDLMTKEISDSMLPFISKINQLFRETKIYGLTSCEALVLLEADHTSTGSDWLVRIRPWGKGFEFDYKMSDEIKPWENARITGICNSLDEAVNYLIIAMCESGGWKDSAELANHRKKLPTTKAKM